MQVEVSGDETGRTGACSPRECRLGGRGRHSGVGRQAEVIVAREVDQGAPCRPRRQLALEPGEATVRLAQSQPVGQAVATHPATAAATMAEQMVAISMSDVTYGGIA